MGVKMIRGPFILLEAVGMLDKFVNGITFRSILNRNRYLGGGSSYDDMSRRTSCLQAILDEVCSGLNPDDPALRFFFERFVIKGKGTCLAQLLTSDPFSILSNKDIRGHGEAICRIWEEIRSNGAWITPESSMSLSFSMDDGCPGDLFDQICALECTAEVHVLLYKALRDFGKTIRELVALVEPLSDKLMDCFQKQSWLIDEVEGYWQSVFSTTSPLDFLCSSSGDEKIINGAGDCTLVAISFMNSNLISVKMAGDVYDKRQENVVIIGCVASMSSVVRSSSSELEEVGAILKLIGEKKRMEILHHLAKDRSYCHELADRIGIDPGNMSRTLTQLYGFGFLRQKRESLINYYEADREAFHNFLELVEEIIFG